MAPPIATAALLLAPAVVLLLSTGPNPARAQPPIPGCFVDARVDRQLANQVCLVRALLRVCVCVCCPPFRPRLALCSSVVRRVDVVFWCVTRCASPGSTSPVL